MSSRVVTSKLNKNMTRLVTAMQEWGKEFTEKPSGLFGFSCVVKIGSSITIDSNLLDVEFNCPFDDDMQANEAEIIVYNLADTTIRNIKNKSKITIEAGYNGDTGVIFSGYVQKAKTDYEDADKCTIIKALDDVSKKTVESLTFAAGTKASYILKTLLNKTGTPIAVFKVRRDVTYSDSKTVDGDLMDLIKQYAAECGISVFVKKGKIYAQYIKNGDDLNFTVQESTGMIGSPEEFTEEITYDDGKETVTGYKINMLLQHRMAAGVITNVKSRQVNGKYRVRKGVHTYSPDSGAETEIEVI